MTKEQIAEELKMSYAELRVKEDLMNYADEDFVESISYGIKEIESRIKALKRRYEKAESAQAEASRYWTNFMFEITGIKKKPLSSKQIGF